ncbi:MAG: hypothetical protein JWN61_1318, partial [Pseudonocardiales bacterium]|nr:hypothetical protein [Pseudonocardiales bacterium]
PAQLPAALAQLLADMVARDPAARPTAADVASRLAVLDLREAPAGFGAADDDRATGVIARPRKPGWLWPVAVAAALLVMVVVGAWRIALDGAPATGPGAGPRPTVSPAANTIAPPHGGPAGTAAAADVVPVDGTGAAPGGDVMVVGLSPSADSGSSDQAATEPAVTGADVGATGGGTQPPDRDLGDPGNTGNVPGHDPNGPGNSENAPGHTKAR